MSHGGQLHFLVLGSGQGPLHSWTPWRRQRKVYVLGKVDEAESVKFFSVSPRASSVEFFKDKKFTGNGHQDFPARAKRQRDKTSPHSKVGVSIFSNPGARAQAI